MGFYWFPVSDIRIVFERITGFIVFGKISHGDLHGLFTATDDSWVPLDTCKTVQPVFVNQYSEEDPDIDYNPYPKEYHQNNEKNIPRRTAGICT